MYPSNNPDIAVAQEWLGDLRAWIGAHGLAGYDPFDVKQHPLLRAAQPHFLRRKAATALCDLFPMAMRRMLRIEQTANPKAFALAALGNLRLYELTQEQDYLDDGLEQLLWLRSHANGGYAGMCWGYPFDVHAKGLDTPANTPAGVICSIAGHAFLRAHRLTGEPEHLDAASSVADFILRDLPRIEEDDGTVCFAYTPSDRRRVHNANLLAVEHLLRVWKAAGGEELLEAALPALEFTLRRQREDGAWYYGEYDAQEPFEEGILRLVDNHHTGFVLRSLHAIQQARPDANTEAALKRGFKFYRRLFTPMGMPVNEYGKYPVDVHAAAEGILCPSVLAGSLRRTQAMALTNLRWAYAYLHNPADGAPYYRKYPFFTSKIAFPRWGAAWMYWALAEYLFHFARLRSGQKPTGQA